MLRYLDIYAKITPKAVYIGLATYSGLYLGLVVTLNLMSNHPRYVPLLVIQSIMLISSGFIAGRLAVVAGWLNGVMVGIAVPVIIVIGLALQDLNHYGTINIDEIIKVLKASGAPWFQYTVLYCGVGGGLSDIARRFNV